MMLSASFLADIVVPAVVFVLMAVVGTDLRTEQLLGVLTRPGSVVICTATQLVLVPAIALLAIEIIRPEHGLAVALALLSVCPGGALSNSYVYINHGHVTLSVVLTAVSTLLAVFTFPVLAFVVLFAVGTGPIGVALPVGRVLLQLVCFVLVPVLIGMAARHRFPSRVTANRGHLDLVATVLLVTTVSFGVVVGWPALAASMAEIAWLAALYTLGTLAVGRFTAAFVPALDRSACTIECAVRNVPIAILLMNNVISDVASIGFATGYFLVHAPVLVAYSLVTRRGTDVSLVERGSGH